VRSTDSSQAVVRVLLMNMNILTAVVYPILTSVGVVMN
jgi:hypothetical protein